MGKIEDELTPEEQQVFDKIFDEVLNDMVECGMITKTNENGTDYYSFQPSEEKDEVKTNVMHPINQATFKRVFWNLFCAF